MPKKPKMPKKIKKSHNRKISDEQFFSVLRENAGLYARTAREIERQFKVKYTRQSVRQRAEAHPEIMRDIEEENLDIAEDGLKTMISEDNEVGYLRLDAIKFFLKTKGKKRGYAEGSEIKHSGEIKTTSKIDLTLLSDEELRLLADLETKSSTGKPPSP
jgi:hypothetical protein